MPIRLNLPQVHTGPFAQPWQRCPVCVGRGHVPQGFYSGPFSPGATHTAPETCRSCQGKGMVR